ncbi:histidine phosphotransferase family protein [Acuticoccus mangrovi]|uniref:Histidine phosphotransferase n=1 Tax=Acuticoccus mangrovi TaxID=2796142 RepID=A0A934IMM4_9HYPH|nr:histidine phosphotransferase family protein [Acuticoccus mangrovi]MBJ3775163.1 histidine phosphotransferase [Acuticoccus mangrovi]
MPTELDLASLLASRLCHDVVGPVGAIQNGLELMAEDDAMTDMALDLIKKSAAQATAKLQYARIAYGAAGGADVIDPGEAGRLTALVFAGERASLDWQWQGAAEPRTTVKLGMLLATYALGAVPRGGTITVRYEDGVIEVAAEGPQLRTPQFLDVVTEGGEIADARGVQALIIDRLAASIGTRVEASADEGRLTLRTTAR